MTRMNQLNNRATFYELKTDNREASSKKLVKIHECFCEDYSPTIKDYTILGSSADQKVVTIKIRNQFKGFQPDNYHLFELASGYFKGIKFNIKSVSPYENQPEYLKVIGEGQENI